MSNTPVLSLICLAVAVICVISCRLYKQASNWEDLAMTGGETFYVPVISLVMGALSFFLVLLALSEVVVEVAMYFAR